MTEKKKRTKVVRKETPLERAKKVIALIADGMSYRQAREEQNIGNSKFFELLESDAQLKEQYARAREKRGETFIDKIEDIEAMLIAGQIDPAAARVLIDAEKWKAAKFYPKMYGDKQQVDVNVTNFSLFEKAAEERAKIYENQSKDPA
jgi:hypothetical protein